MKVEKYYFFGGDQMKWSICLPGKMSEDIQIEKEGSDMESDVPEVPKPGFVRQKVDAVSIP